jgi:hypothetical protein
VRTMYGIMYEQCMQACASSIWFHVFRLWFSALCVFALLFGFYLIYTNKLDKVSQPVCVYSLNMYMYLLYELC